MSEINNNNIITNTIEEVLHGSMIPYAESVILDRALPRVEDGLKPVQRRILYDMYEMGITPDKPYKKSAKVVGDVLAKYHPHGDGSVYDAMVRLAQPFNMGMTLVDGQGNYGNVDGDGAAAMRYTEARLNNLALEMLRDLEKDTVEWGNNYDDTLKEPTTLPSRFPNLLVNGAMGIAVGLATNIPPHNLAEVIDGAVAYIDNPRMKLDEMMKIIEGPDFPTGGEVIVGEELKRAYETGKGKILIRSKFSLEQEKGKTLIVINEIPYQVNKSLVIKKIGENIDEKKDVYKTIDDVVDESDRHGMRVVIRLKKDADPVEVLETLFKDTNLQVSYGINMVMIADGKPQQLGLLDIMRYYTEYQKQVVLRRTKHDLEKAKARYEIVTGLIVAVTNIDKVIQIIKKSPDTSTAKQNLRKAFDLSEAQAQAILDLKLARLTRLEIDNLKDELEQLKLLMKSLQEIIDSKKKLNSVVKEEMLQIKRKFKSPRRSYITENPTKIGENGNSANKKKTAVEKYIVGYSGKGLVRRVKLSAYNRAQTDNPSPHECFAFSVNTTSEEVLYAFTNLGNVFKIDVEDIPEARGLGQGGVTFDKTFKDVSANEVPVSFITAKAGEESGIIYTFTERGMIKASNFADYVTSRTPCVGINLKDKDQVVKAVRLEKDKDEVGVESFFVTEKGMCLRSSKPVSVTGRQTGGVIGMSVADDDKVIYAGFINDDCQVVIGTSFGTFKRVLAGPIPKISGSGKGVIIAELGKPQDNECVVFAEVVDATDKALITIVTRIGLFYSVNLEDILTDKRASKGKNIPKIGSCQPLVVYCARR